MSDNKSAKTPSEQIMDNAMLSSLKEQMPILTSCLCQALRIPEDEDVAGIQHSTVSSMPEDEEQVDCATGSQQEQTKATGGKVARNQQPATSSKAENIMKCIVCGDVTRRKNYGFDICCACANFFGTCIREGKSSELKCENDGMCNMNITQQTRKSCQKCRLYKCLNVGIDLDRLLVSKKALTDYVYFVHLELSHTDGTEPVKTDQWQRFDEVMSPALVRICDFAKRLPGFFRLSLIDRILLVKSSFLEVMAVLASITYDSATESVITMGGHKLVKSHEKKINVNSYYIFFDNFFQMVERIVSCTLDKKALGLIAGLLIFHNKRSQEVNERLKNKDVVDMKRKEFLEALLDFKPKDSSDDGMHASSSGKDPCFISELCRLHNDVRDKILKLKGITKRDTGDILWELFYEHLPVNE